MQDLKRGIRFLHNISEIRHNPLDWVPAGELLSWCDEDAQARYPAIAGLIRFATPSSGAVHLAWTSTARQLLERASDPVAVLRAYGKEFGYVLSDQVSTVERHLPLLDEYTKHENAAVAAFASEEGERLRAAIERARHQERTVARERDERFE